LTSGRNFNVHPAVFSRNVLGDGSSHRKVAPMRVRAPGSYKAEFLRSSRINSPWRFTLVFEEMLFSCERTVSKLTPTVCAISRRPSEVLHRTNLHVPEKSLAGVRFTTVPVIAMTCIANTSSPSSVPKHSFDIRAHTDDTCSLLCSEGRRTLRPQVPGLAWFPQDNPSESRRSWHK
jgi:hypothetical protein